MQRYKSKWQFKKDTVGKEISGARFNEEEKGKVTVAQLKNYLKCRGINQNGHCTEKKLLER